MLLSLLICVFLLQAPSLISSLNQDGLYLQKIKEYLSDPDGVLSDWEALDAEPCNWNGVSCNSQGAVISLSLPSSNLGGPFPNPRFLCRIPSLSFVSLSDNFINGTLPSDLDACQNLTHLNVSQNLLVGSFPPSLAALPSLLVLDLSGNNFSGEVPATFAAFPRLEGLSLVSNLLNGTIPSFFSNVSTLKQLNLSYNPFLPGEIPSDFGKLINLENLWLAGCNLIGQIPPSLGNLGNLTNLDLSLNNLKGPIPETLTSLSSIVQIELYNNSLSGMLPVGLSKLTSLRRLDASMNQLEGQIPRGLCELPLESLNLYENRFTGALPQEIARSPNLFELRLFRNMLNGSLPPDLGKNGPLLWIDLSYNQFSGEIPGSLCYKGVLEEILFIQNSFEGKLPEALAQCHSLNRVRLKGNKLSGEIPAGIWGLPHLSLLEFTSNSFSGAISPAISGASNLSVLLIDNNQFKGEMPPEFGSLVKLEEISAANNKLSGSISTAFGSLPRLSMLDLHNNDISGELPANIELWKKLSYLNLADNQLSGKIPPGFGSLPVLNYLDLSNNRLSGEIPLEFQNLKLNLFNLSTNFLSGKLPPLYANENYRDSFLNNPGLCGDLPGLCSTSEEEAGRARRFVWLLRAIFVLAALVLLIGGVWFYWKYRDFKNGKNGGDKMKWTLTSFHKLGFSEYEIFDYLDEDNVIGSGASGKVYKVVLSNGEAVAVKKLWGSRKGEADHNNMQQRISNDGFEAEVETLGKIRHKNIVKLWCCCTTRDCKLLVYEYMPNGSLGDLLHSSKGGLLDWPTRYKIALEAAEGLSYLHHDCVPSIVHRDVKSNNILLDGEFGARVADFGVAKVCEAIGKGPKSMSVIAGSCGYIAPEYAYTLRVNEKSDIYSFGVVLLELLTGKLPVDPEFGEKDLVKWVCTTFDQKGVEHILDPKLDICFKEEMCKVLNIALLCTSPLPINRPSMRRVVNMLLELGSSNMPKAMKNDGTFSPYYYEVGSDHGSLV
ncbi:receptor-like protein kinase HSL1 [Aristolochia californica]|uniref:receptor-like protein kinase HSL1 n=1 Tax=Aristolochia californica TaxID=171875 RepID=UPI0035E36252